MSPSPYYRYQVRGTSYQIIVLLIIRNVLYGGAAAVNFIYIVSHFKEAVEENESTYYK